MEIMKSNNDLTEGDVDLK